jgi:CHAT domain-containing protein/Tfp pilus assembly protein PilF
MTGLVFLKMTKGIIAILCCLSCFILNQTLAAQPLTAKEFREKLTEAIGNNDVQLASSLITDHRLLVKPLVNTLISEALKAELAGTAGVTSDAFSLADRTASLFEDIFGEKSLVTGVGYLKGWTSDQKRSKLKADSLYALGTAIRGSSQVRERVDSLYKEALGLYESINDERGEAEVLGGMGLNFTFAPPQYDVAVPYYKLALIKRLKVDDRFLTGNTLNSLGSIYYEYYTDYPLALSYLEKAEKIRSEIGDSLGLASTVHVKASVCDHLGQKERAIDAFKLSYDINSRLGNYTRMAEALLNIGTISNNLGKFPEALAYLDDALRINVELDNPYGIIDSHNQTAFVLLKMGDYEKAMGHFDEALAIAVKQDDKSALARIYNNMGIMLQDAGRPSKAIDFYLNAIKIYEAEGDLEPTLPTLNNIGTIHFEQGEYSKAEEYHTRGLKYSRDLHTRDLEGQFLLNLANDQQLQGKLDQALDNYRESMKLASSLNNPDLTWRIYAGLAENYEARGDIEKVVALNDTALDIIEGLRKTIQDDEQKASYMAAERGAFEDVINLLCLLHMKDPLRGYDSLAFQYAENSKSRAFLDLLAESAALKNPVPVSLRQAKGLCPDKNTVLLEYSVGDSSTSLWVITSREHKFYRLPGRKALMDQIEPFRFAISDPSGTKGDFPTLAGTSLYNELVKPAEPYLTGKSRLVIIPDDILNYLPFEVLLTGNSRAGTDKNYRDLPFLLKKYPVSYVQSASVLNTILSGKAERNRQGSGDQKLFAIGDPCFADQNLPRLGYSGREVEGIAALFGTGQADIYLREKATEDIIKHNTALKDYRFIHLATHGLIDEKDPDSSSLVLSGSPGSGEDGLLRTSEIFNLEINPYLVVLSACRTGLGKLVRGEGMIGLTRAFMFAGSPSVAVSLWSVSDSSTATLMTEYYKNMIKKDLNKTEALRQAQLTLLKDEKYAHPFYWAPFILFGDWQ